MAPCQVDDQVERIHSSRRCEHANCLLLPELSLVRSFQDLLGLQVTVSVEGLRCAKLSFPALDLWSRCGEQI